MKFLVAIAWVACGSESSKTPLDAKDSASVSPDQGSEPRDLAREEAAATIDVGVDSPTVDRDVSLSPFDASPKVDRFEVDSAPDAAFVDAFLADVGPESGSATPASGEGCTGIRPNSATFTTEIGLTSLPVSFTITNYAGTAVPSIAADLSGPDLGTFTIAGNTCMGALPPGQTCQISVVFNAPVIPDLRIGILNISGAGAKCAFALVGQAILPPNRNLDSGVADTSWALDNQGPG